MRSTRFILYRKDLGIFVGTALGLAFWSKHEDAGQKQVAAFDNHEQALEFARDVLKIDDAGARSVEAEGDYVTIAELRKAGYTDQDLGMLLVNTPTVGTA